MKITFEYSHGGKNYNSLDAAVMAAMEAGVKKIINDRLAPFQSRLTANGSVVTATQGDTPGSYSFVVSNVPEELEEQVQQALNGE